jgi:predicted amidohydrolase
MRNIRVASVQFEHAAGDKAANLATLERFAAEAAARRVEILACPECCVTGYWFLRNLTREQLLGLAEPVPDGPSTRALLGLSRQHGMTIGAGLVEVDEAGLMHNTYVVAMPDGAWRRHRKIHAFEHDHIVPGSEFTVFDTPHGCRVGVLVCYDCNINENVRITALMGAEVLLAPHQTGGCASKNPHQMGLIERRVWDARRENPAAIEAELKGDKGRAWLMRWLPSRAHDNGLFVMFSNGVGIDDDEVRTGNAMILDPYGRILAETWAADDAMVVADLDAGLLANTTGSRWISTRRPELYGSLTVPTGKEKNTRAVRFDEVGG